MFQGADVSGLDRMAQKAQEGADYAKKVAMALKILVRALKAMSWTGWAATYAAYLQATVIPWVEATGEALERFAQVLRLASAVQKAVSEDSPQVAVPTIQYTSPQLPTSSAVNAPTLSRPDTAVSTGDMPTIAVGEGAVVVVPISIGGTASALGQSGAQGGGGQVTTPSGVTVSWGGSTGAAGGSAAGAAPTTAIASSFGPAAPGSASGYSAAGVSVPAPLPPASSAAAPVGGSSSLGGTSGLGTTPLPAGSASSPGALGGTANGTGLGAAVGAGTLGGSVLGSAGTVGGEGRVGVMGPPGRAASPDSSGSLGGSGALGGSLLGAGSSAEGAGSAATGAGSGSGSDPDTPARSGVPGDPAVRATPVTAATGAGTGGLTALGVPGALDTGSTLNPAALAAPLGLAGLGAAGLGALRSRSDSTAGGGDLLDQAED